MEAAMSKAIAKAAVRVVTSEFEFSHGRKPRGYGLWWFEFRWPNGGSDMASWTGSFTEARKRAVARAVEVGCSDVRVGA